MKKSHDEELEGRITEALLRLGWWLLKAIIIIALIVAACFIVKEAL